MWRVVRIKDTYTFFPCKKKDDDNEIVLTQEIYDASTTGEKVNSGSVVLQNNARKLQTTKAVLAGSILAVREQPTTKAGTQLLFVVGRSVALFMIYGRFESKNFPIHINLVWRSNQPAALRQYHGITEILPLRKKNTNSSSFAPGKKQQQQVHLTRGRWGRKTLKVCVLP